MGVAGVDVVAGAGTTAAAVWHGLGVSGHTEPDENCAVDGDYSAYTADERKDSCVDRSTGRGGRHDQRGPFRTADTCCGQPGADVAARRLSDCIAGDGRLEGQVSQVQFRNLGRPLPAWLAQPADDGCSSCRPVMRFQRQQLFPRGGQLPSPSLVVGGGGNGKRGLLAGDFVLFMAGFGPGTMPSRCELSFARFISCQANSRGSIFQQGI